jgi:NAD dependent epimerase/dehydratase family enzyme
MGNGRQYWPWISLADVIGAMHPHLTAAVTAPVNLPGPAPATNAEFTKELGRLLGRPTVLPVPGFVLTTALGEFGRSSVVGGQRALPTRLEESGFRFTHPDLTSALRAALGRD